MKIEFGSIQLYTGGKTVTPTVTIELVLDETPATDAATGNGPIDAGCNAIIRILRAAIGYDQLIVPKVYEFTCQSSGTGTGALARARMLERTQNIFGEGEAFDTVEAALRAYLELIVKMNQNGLSS